MAGMLCSFVAHHLICTLKTGSLLAMLIFDGLLASSGLLVVFSIIALGRCLGALPPERYGIRIPKKMRKNDAMKIELKMIFLFIKVLPN